MTNHTPSDLDFANDFLQFFTGTDGADSPSITLTGSAFIGVATLSTVVNEQGLYATDGATDNVTVDGGALVDPTGLQEDVQGRSVIALGFGPEDRLDVTNISGDQAQVTLFTEGDTSLLPPGSEDFIFPGAVINFDGQGFIYLASTEGTPFADQAAFNQAVNFVAGGSPSFTETIDLSQIFDQFVENGTLPENEIPGVFELPDDPQPGDTVEIEPVTITIGGEEVTLDPTDPFWFDNLPARAREELLADPEIAIGYDYRIVNPEPGQAFATIRAPEVNNDTSYNLIAVSPGGEPLETREIQAGVTIDLESDYENPVTNFILEGISPQANLDPDDARAFPLAVSFAQDGEVDMQQTPLVRGFDFSTETAADVKGTAAAFYIGYYGRAPEPGGFSYWQSDVQTQADGGAGVFDIASNLSARFRNAEETKELYPFLDREAGASITDADADEFVVDVYQNLFNRDPEAAGLDYWSDQVVSRVTSGESIADIIIKIMDSAESADAVTVGNKIDVGIAYADAYSADRFENDRATLPDINDIVDNVDDTDASVASALATIEAAQANGTESLNALGLPSSTEDLVFG